MALIGVYVERYDSDPADADMASGGGIGDLVRANPAIIKVHNSRAQLQWAHDAGYKGILLYRNMALLEDPFNGQAPSAGFADFYWKAIKPHIKGLQWAVIDTWPNEPSVDVAELQALDEYYARLAILARNEGYTIAAYAFSAEGAAALADGRWRHIAPSLKALKDNGHWLDLHGYYGPMLHSPGYAQFLYPWRALRQLVPSLPNVLAGEFGIDSNIAQGIDCPGYRTVTDNAGYAAQLLAADNQLKLDNVPACIYLATRANCPDDQIQYNILIDDSKKNDYNPSVWARIQGSIADKWSSIIEVPPPPVEPPPTPPPGPSFPAWYIVKTGGTDRLRKRLAPNTSGEIVELQVNGSELLIESIDANNWAKLKGAPVYCSAQYLVRK